MGDAAVGAYELQMQGAKTGTGLLEITLPQGDQRVDPAGPASNQRSGQYRRDDDGDHDDELTP